ncbi:jg1911 [Pararge aegeria aegeria]|uniref:Jg1911 protein n=1 Tax=Pararge aegeria aegeria TaxID=348720 RepID=A0A8S4R5E3_9NEOP|nr:jg1911 [Pararge aegeria aegeria]
MKAEPDASKQPCHYRNPVTPIIARAISKVWPLIALGFQLFLTEPHFEDRKQAHVTLLKSLESKKGTRTHSQSTPCWSSEDWRTSRIENIMKYSQTGFTMLTVNAILKCLKIT